ncbi:MAG: hypothetical protein EZS28_004619 [Streblomastix strix]|uniref:Uncharacterized protein n=1 Tax=Streblomastix strix TaxID=222440 RepID=A0A5J4WZA3_9EUKA|nr:MAG: hypothetical protein EZS28_004619 [Streblomastix strix]
MVQLSSIETVRQFLIHDHNAFEHIASLFIAFTRNINIEFKPFGEMTKNALKSITPNPNVVSGALNLLDHLTNSSAHVETASIVPSLIYSLMQLSKFKVHLSEDEQMYKQMALIRKQSLRCLWMFQSFGGIKMQELLVHKHEYFTVISNIIGSGGGSCEQERQVIQRAFNNIIDAIRRLRWGCILTTSALPGLHKESEEQLESEGSFEEIDSIGFHSIINEGADNITDNVRSVIMNSFKYKSRSKY